MDCFFASEIAALSSAWFMIILHMQHFVVIARGKRSLLPVFSSLHFDAVQLCWEPLSRLWFWTVVSQDIKCFPLYRNCHWPRNGLERGPEALAGAVLTPSEKSGLTFSPLTRNMLPSKGLYCVT